MTIGTSVLLVAAVALILLVQRELAPQGGLSLRGKWLLTAALGAGITVMALKLLLIALFVSMPETTLSSWLYRQPGKATGPDWQKVTAPDGPRVVKTSGYLWQALPLDPPVDQDDPVVARKVALGEQLFNETSLSLDRTLSCSSCHDLLQSAGTDGRRTSTGIAAKVGPRNAPSLWNTAYLSVLFWDGRAPTLEAQAKGPMTNPLEMGMPSYSLVERRVREIPAYQQAFADIYGPQVPITIDLIVDTIATYERTLVTPDTAYDRFVRGDRDALTDQQLRGMALFQETGCVICHAGPMFTVAGTSLETDTPFRRFPAIKTPYAERFDLLSDPGRLDNVGTRGVWRVPSLRNVALTAPYFHNGSVDSLEEAVRIMSSVQLNRPLPEAADIGRTVNWSHRDKTLTSTIRKPLSEGDVRDIVAFLKGLSSDRLLTSYRNTSRE
ncbi:MAG: hypothetical protein CMI01_06535 [Oceanospirillaceae bacterium]|nr:hypothetical protein [Oceanospirillaceae bacterium]